MNMRYLLAIMMVSGAGFGRGLQLKNGTFSEALNASVRCGVVSQIKVTNVPVSILDLDALLKAGKFEPDEPFQQALTSRAPGAGNIFIIVTFDVNKGFSIGRYDYVLRLENKAVPIEAISMTGKPFDPRVWELKAENGFITVDALFETPLPSGPVTALLEPRLDTTIRYGDVKLPIGRKGDTAAAVRSGEKPPAAQSAEKPAAAQSDKKASGNDVVYAMPKQKAPAKPATKKASAKTPPKKPAKKPAKKTAADDLDDLF